MRTFCVALFGATMLTGCSMTVAGSIPDAKGHVRPYTLHVDSRTSGRDLVAKSLGFSPIFAAAPKGGATHASAAAPVEPQALTVADVADAAVRVPAQIDALRRDVTAAVALGVGGAIVAVMFVAVSRRRRTAAMLPVAAAAAAAAASASAASAAATVAEPVETIALAGGVVLPGEARALPSATLASEATASEAPEPEPVAAVGRRCACDARISERSRTGRCRRCARQARIERPRVLHVDFLPVLAAPRSDDAADDDDVEPVRATLALSRIGKHREYYVVAGDRLAASTRD